jgi:hypothetical protein
LNASGASRAAAAGLALNGIPNPDEKLTVDDRADLERCA